MNSDITGGVCRRSAALPAPVLLLLGRLEAQGHEAYVVGGCVRDLLRGVVPKDYDLCTNAHPAQVKAAFSDVETRDIGARHGTIGVLLGEIVYEITSYRSEGDYSDGRRPDSVSFEAGLSEDLARRDFTMNAMAYHPRRGLVDLYGGAEDLAAGRIRAVGDAARRLAEDALRILRGLRFAAVYGFTIEATTEAAMREAAPLLTGVAAERVWAECSLLLQGAWAADVLTRHREICAAFLPMLRGDSTADPNAAARWQLCMTALHGAPQEISLRLALLLYGSAAVHEGAFGTAAQRRALCYEEALSAALRYPKKTRERLRLLLEACCDEIVPTREEIGLCLYRYEAEGARALLSFRLALAMAAGDEDMMRRFHESRVLLEQLLREGVCVSLSDLAVNGADLLSLGFQPGRALGDCLKALLLLVIAGEVENTKEALLHTANRIRANGSA